MILPIVCIHEVHVHVHPGVLNFLCGFVKSFCVSEFGDFDILGVYLGCWVIFLYNFIPSLASVLYTCMYFNVRTCMCTSNIKYVYM